MKANLFNLAILTAAAALASTAGAQARFMRVETEQVPIARLLKNLEAKEKTPNLNKNDQAALEFQMGRLHAMAYAVKGEEAPVHKGDSPAEQRPFFGYSFSDYRQFNPEATTDAAKMAAAKNHLTQAIAHLKKAHELNPTSNATKLGLAWALGQNGNKQEAIPLYREVFKQTYADEVSKTGLEGSSITVETGDYLKASLNPAKDAAEIQDINQKQAAVHKGFRMVTPIAVPLIPDLRRSQLMDPCQVEFDLDGTGPRTCSSWPGSKAGWLVYRAHPSMGIESGLQLFGQATFWVFWRNGYEALSALDDNQDGAITHQEMNGLAIWQDMNRNGVSEDGEVRTLPECGITALSCASEADPEGFLYSPGGVSFASGKRADTWDVLVPSSI